MKSSKITPTETAKDFSVWSGDMLRMLTKLKPTEMRANDRERLKGRLNEAQISLTELQQKITAALADLG